MRLLSFAFAALLSIGAANADSRNHLFGLYSAEVFPESHPHFVIYDRRGYGDYALHGQNHPWTLKLGDSFGHIEVCEKRVGKYKLPDLTEDGKIQYKEIVLNNWAETQNGYGCAYSKVAYDDNQQPVITDVYYSGQSFKIRANPGVYRITSGWFVNDVFVDYIGLDKVMARLDRDHARPALKGTKYQLKLWETNADKLTRVPGGWINQISFVPYEPYREAKQIANTGK